MKKKKNKARPNKLFRAILIILFLVGIIAAGYYFFLLPRLTKETPVKPLVDALFGWKFPVAKFPTTGIDGKLLAYSNIRDPGGVPQGLPVRLKIPSIGVNSAIEDAQITPDGRMDVPSGTVNVAWFSLGPHPGKEGSAVIGGHYGRYEANKGPTVFFKLDKLKAGDKVYIQDDKGDTLAFQVTRVQLFNRDADATPVFTSSDGKAHLNLITCEGVWNKVNDSYPDRRVVFTDFLPGEGAPKPAPTAAKPGLPKTAITPTKSSPAPTLSPTPTPTIEPTSTPSEDMTTPSTEKKTPISPQILIASVKSLYATPTDGLITSVLLLSILFIGFSIIRR